VSVIKPAAELKLQVASAQYLIASCSSTQVHKYTSHKVTNNSTCIHSQIDSKSYLLQNLYKVLKMACDLEVVQPNKTLSTYGRWGSAVGITNRLRAGWSSRGFIPDKGRSFLYNIHTPLGPTQPPLQWVSGALFPRIKRQRRQDDCSPPFSAQVKMELYIHSNILHHDFGDSLIKPRNNFTFFLPSVRTYFLAVAKVPVATLHIVIDYFPCICLNIVHIGKV
jgi:hypothetical protein